jgi:predicted nucleotidyltransferase
MLSKEEILRLLKRELPFIKKKYNVSRVALFGSYVRGDQNEKSDLDMLVEFSRPVGFFKFIELEDYLSEKLGVKVDLVTPDALKSLIKPHVMEEAVYA